jgi:hypothetical protein
VEFSEDDLRIIIGLCELDHKVTDLLGPRTPLPDMVRHRYKVSSLAQKASIRLMQIQAERQRQIKGDGEGITRLPDNGAVPAP